MSQEVPFKRSKIESKASSKVYLLNRPQDLYDYQGTEIKKYQLVPLDTVLSILKSHIQNLFPSRTKVGTELEHSPKPQ